MGNLPEQTGVVVTGAITYDGTDSRQLIVYLEDVKILKGYPKAKLIAHLEKSLNAFIAKTKKEEVL